MIFDVTIVGGGMVGASLAVALERLGVKVALIEAVAHDAASQPSFDERTTALSNASRRIFDTLSLWPAIAAAATPITKIHVSDQGHFGFARIDAALQGLDALGYVVPNRALGAALWSRAATNPALRVFCPAQVLAITPGDLVAQVSVSETGGTVTLLETKLVVAADGVQSMARAAFGVASSTRDYGQTAVITTVLPERFHNHVAYERFTRDGPLALLPIDGGRCTLVLTLAPELAQQAMAWSDAEFLSEVQRRFGFRLGRFLQVGRRVPYPLSLSVSEQTSRGRAVILGNAAQGLHPIAGMGFNLGLRDVACLAELVADYRARGVLDAGSPTLLSEYDSWRASDRRGIIAFTDGLVRTFSSPLRIVGGLRNLALLAFDLLPPAKSALSRLSSGASRRVPKLARGVSLE